jgi:hypothetical protein
MAMPLRWIRGSSTKWTEPVLGVKRYMADSNRGAVSVSLLNHKYLILLNAGCACQTDFLDRRSYGLSKPNVASDRMYEKIIYSITVVSEVSV